MADQSTIALPPGFDREGRPENDVAARRVINRISAERGFLSDFDEQQLSLTDPEWQQDYRRRAEETRQLYARYTKTAAKQVYTSKFRFIHELVQNADDAEYEEGIQPTIKFIITPTELIIELNELGFTLANVYSICNTGSSSKIGDSSTIGEKGLGFKSVFAIADVVHIRSGLWSFRFEHRSRDGIGMILPLWTDVVDGDPCQPGTRIRLEYSDLRDSFVKKLISAFECLSETIVFALRQLQRLEMTIQNIPGCYGSVAFSCMPGLQHGSTIIETILDGNFGKHKSQVAYFKEFEATFTGLPTDEDRSSDETTVMIAFEVDEFGTAVIPADGQHVFAYLPIQRFEQLPFLIHADFVLLINRQGVLDSERNETLRKAIAHCFAQAVQQLCHTDHPLAYQWMQYCPVSAMTDFWAPLKSEIIEALQSVPVLFSRRARLKLISDLRYLPDWFVHAKEPLVPDITMRGLEDVYLSPKYSKANTATLRNTGLGLQVLSNRMIVDRISFELSTGRIHQKPLDDVWHDAFIKALTVLRKDTYVCSSVEDLQVIPLEDGRWVSATSLSRTNVYLPIIVGEDTVQIRIPEGLDFQLLHSTACSNGVRLDFYMSFGISACNPDLVIQRIQDNHKRLVRRKVKDWIADLEILFWYDEPRTPLAPSRYSYNEPQGGFYANCDDAKLRQMSSIFFPSDKPCDAQSLLSKSRRTEYEDYGLLSQQVLQSKVHDKIRGGRDWTTWLKERGVSHHLPLTVMANRPVFGFSNENNSRVLHPLMTLVARDNSTAFIDSLREHWQSYQFEMASVIEEIKNLTVLCLDDTRHHLKNTILPTEDILAKSRILWVEDKLPFLKIPREAQRPVLSEWRCFEDLNVTCQVNKSFYLAALRALLAGDKHDRDLTPATTAIYRGLAESFQMKDVVELQSAFNSESLIYVYSGGEYYWNRIDACVWDGLPCLSKYQVLAPVYGKDHQAAVLFRDLLKMQDATYHHLIGELRDMSSRDNTPARQKLLDIYSELSQMGRDKETRTYIKAEIDQHGLIYGRSRWLTPTACLWNCTVEISGKEPLDEFYLELRTFFVEHLRVMPMTPDVLVQELDRLSKRSVPDFQEARRIVLALGQILATQSKSTLTDKSLATLKKSALFPARGPNGRSLVSHGDDFYINDHKRYGNLFLDKLDILDFDYEDLTSLHPLFQLLKLEDHYISSLVEARTTVEDYRRNDELTNHFRGLSYALSCCAIAHNSVKYLNKSTKMHDLLTQSEIYVCETMWTELTAGETTVRSERAVVRIDEARDCLQIYVPSDRDGLYSCYCTELPVELVKALGIEDRGASKIIYRIINDQLKDLDTIMRDEDLCHYPWLERPSKQSQHLSLPFDGQDNHAHQRNDGSEGQGIGDDETTIVVTRSIGQRFQPEASTIHAEPDLDLVVPLQPPWQRVARSAQFRKLLQSVIDQGSSVLRQSQDPFSFSQLDYALHNIATGSRYAELASEFSYIAPQERAWIGAAGELFIVERLLALEVDDFSLDDWRSKVRHHVRIHPACEHVGDWKGEEKADIMYYGSCAKLVRFLIDCSATDRYPPFLDRALSRPVNFHLEVKATTGPCHVPFFLSQKQYRLMRDIACDPDEFECPADLYVILRVCELASSEIRVTAYINPWHLQKDLLEFMADPYRVTPIV